MKEVKYTVVVEMSLKEHSDEKYYFNSVRVKDSIGDNKENIEDTTVDIIQAREEAFIAGLTNCLYLSDKAGHMKQHESLEKYIKVLKEYYVLSCVAIEKEKEG